jgi:hypothetical protein
MNSTQTHPFSTPLRAESVASDRAVADMQHADTPVSRCAHMQLDKRYY